MTNKVFFTSDHHFGHANIIEFESKRSHFSDIKEHDDFLIDAWNSTVSKSDTVYHLGDFAWRGKELFKVVARKLNGNIHLIRGNHDDRLNRIQNAKVFASVSDIKQVTIDKQKFVLCHYPILSWPAAHHGSIHLHGHCHGNLEKGIMSGPYMDVGIDCEGNPMHPMTLEEVLDRLPKDKYNPRDHHV